MYDICILGSGLIGKLVAWRLSLLGKSVIIFEQSDKNIQTSAAYVAAAMLSPIAESLDSTRIITYLGIQSLKLWDKWIQELTSHVFFQKNGTLIIWHPQDNYLAKTFINNLKYKNIKQYEMWDKKDLIKNERSIASKFDSGIFLKDEAQLDNRQLLHALNLSLKNNQVKSIYNTKCYIKEAYKYATWVIDARGVGSKSDWNNFNKSMLRGVRGEIIRIHCPSVILNRPIRLLHPRYPIYISPKENYNFVIGATQIESEDTSPISVKSALDLLSSLYFVNSNFSEARIVEINTQLRPTLNHHNPQIIINKKNKIVSINGLYRHGFLIAPKITDIVLKYILNNEIQNNIKSIINFIEN